MPMDALTDFHRQLIDIYATSVEIEAGIIRFSEWLGEQERAIVNRDYRQKPVAVIRDDPNSPSTKYQFKKTLGHLQADSMENGLNIQFHRKGVIALTYAIWEDNYRGKIAAECRLKSRKKNDVRSDVFADLNKYRQAILHVDGRLDRDSEILNFFVKGDVVEFSEPQMHELFAQLVEELNRIGGEYYGANPGLTFDSPIIRPNSPEAEQFNQADYLLLLLRDVRVPKR